MRKRWRLLAALLLRPGAAWRASLPLSRGTELCAAPESRRAACARARDVVAISGLLGASWTPEGARAAAEPPAALTRASNEVLAPASVLLRTLPVSNRYFRRLQELLETVSVVRPCTQAQVDAGDDEGAWGAVEAAAGEAVQVLARHRSALSPAFRGNDTVEVQIRRAEGSERDLADFRRALGNLVLYAKERRVEPTLRAQERALLCLNYIGEWMVKEFPYSIPLDAQLENLPRLQGRAAVQVTLRRKAERARLRDATTNFTVVLDGYAAPLAAGNVLDLCFRNYYRGLTFNYTIASTDREGGGVPVLLGGIYEPGFVDPITGKLRLVPLEVLRQSASDPKKRQIAFGAARNSALFTRDPPVVSFVNAGALGLFHPPDDANGGNAIFFAARAPPETKRYCRQVPVADRMDGRYSAFGWIVEREGLLSEIKPGDVVEAVTVVRGGEALLRKAPTFTKILASGGEED